VATRYVTEASMRDTLEKIGGAVRKAIDEEVGKRMMWCGTWRSGRKYKHGDTVNDKGSAWTCVSPETSARPGTGAGWQLLFKAAK
jgi:chitodextrinase